ncbi:hypothetical protein [Desertivirga brevis]|uniref:hypothetical protein n=1 Tax=Desertivirga brevis TaxID=2810310 RepID=UPI001A976CA4|nr:hypothetical protein [Pedobacter sp. SYSU D00873]
MSTIYPLQDLNITNGWTVERNVFYDIGPDSNVSEDDKFINIYCQQDMLAMKKGQILLDLGWYGGEDLNNKNAGYCIYLVRGDCWDEGELLEKFRSKNKQSIIDKINELILAVDNNIYDNSRGRLVYEHNESTGIYVGDSYSYSVLSSK